jgi:hypothetical protein
VTDFPVVNVHVDELSSARIKLKTHSGFHDIFFDSDMSKSKSTDTVVYFDWKRLFVFTFAEYVAHNLCCQIRADDNSSTCTFTTTN